MRTRAQIKDHAKSILRQNYGDILGEMVLVWILSSLAGSTIVGLIIVPALLVGFFDGLIKLWRGTKKETLFTGFAGNKFGRSLGSMLLMGIFVWLWSLLLIVPGIIMALAYSMTPFIVADSDKVSCMDAITLSRRITKGHKGKIFVFYLSYIGWYLLSMLTFGLLFIFYTGPYFYTAYAGLYEELKKNAIENGVVTEEELA